MSNIEIVMDDKTHLLQVRRLWEEIFSEDAASYLDFYFTYVYPENSLVLAKDNGSIIGMIHMNPYQLENSMIYYIVGVATMPEYRGQGIMRKMMDFGIAYAKEKNIKELILLPVDERFYGSFGFEFVSRQYNTHLLTPHNTYASEKETFVDQLSNNLYKDIKTSSMFTEAMNALKRLQENKYLPYEAIWNIKYLESLYAEMMSENGKIISVDGHIVLYYLEDVLEIRTVFYHPTNSLDSLKKWLIKTAQNKTIILHEVNQRKISNLFTYHQQNVYDQRPYMMLRSDRDVKDDSTQENYFNEVV